MRLLWCSCWCLVALMGFYPGAGYAATAVAEKMESKAGDGSYTFEPKDEEGELKILDAAGISALDDKGLVEAYIDTAVELEALKTFHATSGFTAKEYKKYKKMIKYRIQLLWEIQRRKLDVAPLPD
jgi:hypothetical protein